LILGLIILRLILGSGGLINQGISFNQLLVFF